MKKRDVKKALVNMALEMAQMVRINMDLHDTIELKNMQIRAKDKAIEDLKNKSRPKDDYFGAPQGEEII